MASLPALSPRSPTNTSPPSTPLGPRSFSGTAFLPTTPAFGLPRNPPSLLERRGEKTSSLNVTAFHTASAHSHTDSETRTPASLSPSTETLYDVLGVARTASESEIKSSYRRLARQFHPDVVPVEAKEASAKMFLKVHSAYVALSDPQSRARYDLQLSIQEFQTAGYKNKFSRVGNMRMPNSSSPIRTPSSYCSPRSSYSVGRGRSWESDQCWF